MTNSYVQPGLFPKGHPLVSWIFATSAYDLLRSLPTTIKRDTVIVLAYGKFVGDDDDHGANPLAKEACKECGCSSVLSGKSSFSS